MIQPNESKELGSRTMPAVALHPPSATSPADDPSPNEVLNWLRLQAELYAGLESLAARQHALVTRDDVGPLLSVLADRRKISDGLEKIVSRLTPVRRRWDVYSATLTSEQREAAEDWLAQAENCLKSVMRSDEQDARVLSSRKQAVGAALSSSQAKGRAVSAYAASGERMGRLDCTDERT